MGAKTRHSRSATSFTGLGGSAGVASVLSPNTTATIPLRIAMSKGWSATGVAQGAGVAVFSAAGKPDESQGRCLWGKR